MNLLKTELTNDKIDEIFQDFYSYNEDEEHISMPVGRAKKKLATLIHQAEIKARIDEVKKAIEWFEDGSGYLFYLDDQLSALEKEIE